jgi:hypothetical protein
VKNYLAGIAVGLLIYKTCIDRGRSSIVKEVDRDVSLFEKYEEGHRKGFRDGRAFEKDQQPY